MTKGEALLQAIRQTSVGSNVIVHNSDKQIWCILKVIAKEHDEDKTDDGGFIWPKGENL
jgi:hypothetical protein